MADEKEKPEAKPEAKKLGTEPYCQGCGAKGVKMNKTRHCQDCAGRALVSRQYWQSAGRICPVGAYLEAPVPAPDPDILPESGETPIDSPPMPDSPA